MLTDIKRKLEQPYLDKIDVKPETITTDKKVQNVIIKRSIQKEYLTIVNIYACNMGAAKYIK